MTIYRRRREMEFMDDFWIIPDDHQLNELVRAIRSENPQLGQMLILGRLGALDYHVTRDRLHQAIRSQDPLNNALLMPRGLTARRTYFRCLVL